MAKKGHANIAKYNMKDQCTEHYMKKNIFILFINLIISEL